nr:MAG: hypothetical protein [Microvirus Sku120]
MIMYNPQFQTTNFKQTSWAERASDRLFGTNYQGRADAENREQAQITANKNAYEMQQAVNMNKYSWNVQGMQAAGINPLAASGSVGSLGSANQGTSAGGMDQGGLGEFANGLIDGVKDMLHEISPATMLRDAKSLVKDLL